MNKIVFNIIFLCLILTGASGIYAQRKNICISEDLAANSEILKVKLGISANGKFKIRFGDYKIAESKTSGIETVKSNFWGTKSERKRSIEFSFHLIDKSTDTAIVNTSYKTSLKEVNSFQLLKNFYVGDDEILHESDFFISFIALSSNRDDVWELIIENTYDKDIGSMQIAFLTNKERLINITYVSSKDCQKDKRLFPARGYEFIENEQTLCAMQYSGGGVFGQNKYIVWLNNNLDQKMKLILAAAMTTLIEGRAHGHTY